jgi:hypothetical protein
MEPLIAFGTFLSRITIVFLIVFPVFAREILTSSISQTRSFSEKKGTSLTFMSNVDSLYFLWRLSAIDTFVFPPPLIKKIEIKDNASR